jgi:hypothetical protein
MTRKRISRPPATDLSKDRLVHKVLHLFAGMSPREVTDGTEMWGSDEDRPVATATVRSWRRPVKAGGTRYPRAHTMNRVLWAHGYELTITRRKTNVDYSKRRPSTLWRDH